MKHFTLVFLAAVFLVGCKNGDSQRATKSNPETETKSSEASPSSINQVDSLTKEQTQRLDRRIPPKIREILDGAEEITIFLSRRQKYDAATSFDA